MVIYLKKGILILVVLAVIVMASGCIDSGTTNKTYSNNGVSFTYPGDWSELDKSDFQNSESNVLVAVGDKDKSTFALATVTIGSNQRLATTKEWAASYKSGMLSNGYTFISEKSRTVDGQNGYEVVMQKSGIYTSNTYFAKDGTPYLAAFASTSNDEQTVNMILNSLKVP